MKNKKITAVHVGFGEMGKVIVRYMIERDIDVIGVFNRSSHIGKPISRFIKVQEKNDVLISNLNYFESFLKSRKPDICMISTSTSMADQRENLLICARNSVNAITIAEEAIYPWNSSPDIADEINHIAKKNNCTITGSGYQDIFWGVIVDTLATSAHKVKKISLKSRYGVNGCGTRLADDHGCGISIEEFIHRFGKYNNASSDEVKAAILCNKLHPSLMWMQNGWLCSKLGLTPISQTQVCMPVVNDIPVYMEAYDRWIPAGQAAGLEATVTTQTEEGVVIESINIGKVDIPGEGGECKWEITGEPNISVSMPNPDDIALTCAPAVNRIPAVINAPAGFVTTDKLPNATLWHK